MPLQNPQDIAAHAALGTGVHGVGAGIVAIASWILEETLTPAADTAIGSSTFAAHDRWLIELEVVFDIGAAGEQGINLRINDDAAANYNCRVIDDTTIVVSGGANEIALGTSYRDDPERIPFIATFEVAGKSRGQAGDKVTLCGHSGGDSVTYNSLVNASYRCGVADITKFTFMFTVAATGKIKIYSQDY